MCLDHAEDPFPLSVSVLIYEEKTDAFFKKKNHKLQRKQYDASVLSAFYLKKIRWEIQNFKMQR